ncbi:MAG: C40 family peptidase [Deltaproteobacteria bacterium]|nr:C40 family peptidase [Deltaproteobacteria bacterium]
MSYFIFKKLTNCRVRHIYGQSVMWTTILPLLVLLGACGLQVGSGVYIGEHNAAPRAPYRFDRNAAASALTSRSFSSGTSLPAGNKADQAVAWPSGSKAPVQGGGTSVVRVARSQTGVPYRSGGTTPQRGFDCSGLIYWVYQQHGVSVPRVAKSQALFGDRVNAGALRPGDIVAFRVNGDYHTGIYSGNGKFIHSPKPGSKVREESINTNYWSDRFVGGRRVLPG